MNHLGELPKYRLDTVWMLYNAFTHYLTQDWTKIGRAGVRASRKSHRFPDS